LVYCQIASGAGPLDFKMIIGNLGFLLRKAPLAARRASQHLEKAIAAAEAIDARHLSGLAYFELGRLHQTKKRADAARSCLEKAIQALGACGGEHYVQAARKALDALP
jgi:tetratricopeptide (TPR) repeat protein